MSTTSICYTYSAYFVYFAYSCSTHFTYSMYSAYTINVFTIRFDSFNLQININAL